MPLVSKNEALKSLKSGYPVGLPTETVYGLAAPIGIDGAIEKIYEIKGRPPSNPLIVHVSGIAMCASLIQEVSPEFLSLAKTFWPGPLTLVMKRNPSQVSDLVTAGKSTVALRAPNSRLFQEILKEFENPLAAPSANPFKKLSPTRAEDVLGFFPDLPVLDGGPCDVGIESTIFDVDNKTILRLGGITQAQIEDTIQGRVKIERSLDENSPGLFKEHYRPHSKLVVVENALEEYSDLVGKQEILLPDNEQLAAQKLYLSLREADQKSDPIVLVWKKSWNTQVWDAVRNRLERACTEWRV